MQDVSEIQHPSFWGTDQLDAFELEVLKRLPLAESVWIAVRYAWDHSLLEGLFERFRGTGWTGKITFGQLVDLVGEALTRYQGSGSRCFEAARKDGRLTASEEAAYGKLRRVPPDLSQSFLLHSTVRLQEILPANCQQKLPPALEKFAVVVIDGKKIKNLAKRLKPLRSLRGKALGAKALAALLVNEGLVFGMEVSLDGEANDAPLMGGLLAQLAPYLPGRTGLLVADRQFCDLKVPHAIVELGDHFLIRYSKKMLFSPEKTHSWQDALGRSVCEEWGWLGRASDRRRIYVRRITLQRPGEEDVSLVTSLLDAEEVPGDQLLQVYLERWGIERIFQQLTEVFQLQQLISSSPSGAVFQFAVCAVLYNVIILIRQYIAESQGCDPSRISTEKLFVDVCEEAIAYHKLVGSKELATCQPSLDAIEVRDRLTQKLQNCWSDSWLKAKPKKKTAPSKKTATKGGHFSAWKIIQKSKTKRSEESAGSC